MSPSTHRLQRFRDERLFPSDTTGRLEGEREGTTVRDELVNKETSVSFWASNWNRLAREATRVDHIAWWNVCVYVWCILGFGT